MSQSTLYDVIVVGAGTMGMATGAFLAQAKVKTLLLDAFNPPHNYGSHHGETRMIRHAYGEGHQYVSLLQHAQALWEELERESSYKIFEKTGVLGIGQEHSPFIKETLASADRYNLPLQIMSSRDIMKKWPGIMVPRHFIGCFEADSGFLYSENCIEAYKALALKNKAELMTHTPVLDIETTPHKIKVRTPNNTYLADKVIVTVGASSPKLLRTLKLPIQPLRKVFAWFAPKEKVFESSRFPCFYLDEGSHLYYGFPSVKGSGLKLGHTNGGLPIAPDQHKQNFGAYDEDEDELRDFLKKYMPKANGELVRGRTCLLSRSIDNHFIIDHYPENKNILFASGFSGHGFKFASIIGKALSQLATQGITDYDLSPFSLARFK
ncbi:monomeric sarcosine oxidase [Pullulanibacillus pueri]|uniref:N-methyltryptophan oxidase n=1 Tax=Pullulanibacillus pueri TaxID=1437324 RepID=A0A8J3EMC3_9BACL|nr:N-methyl-L-tryptophan oxidase [Pullulanibacillus pueri]MBM7682854.1 monomeric sarcosine oxidase [Pullulanibacillus pueri]GGH84296.1 N-methyltryptophan oxidase [Pullulanibacillus pueri]